MALLGERIVEDDYDSYWAAPTSGGIGLSTGKISVRDEGGDDSETYYDLPAAWDPEADDIEDAVVAKEKAYLASCIEPGDETQWFRYTLYRTVLLIDIDEDEDEGYRIDERDQKADIAVTVHPEEPECTWHEGHEWVHEQVWGHGGGVVVTEDCRHCGIRVERDSWAQDMSTGEQGLNSVSYSELYDDPDWRLLDAPEEMQDSDWEGLEASEDGESYRWPSRIAMYGDGLCLVLPWPGEVDDDDIPRVIECLSGRLDERPDEVTICRAWMEWRDNWGDCGMYVWETAEEKRVTLR